MTEAEYSAAQHRLLLLAAVVQGVDLGGFLARISHSHAVAPITDPTLYRMGAGKLLKVEALARSLQPFAEEVRRQVAEAEAVRGSRHYEPGNH